MLSWHLDSRSHDGSTVYGRVIMTILAVDKGCQRGCHDGLLVTSTCRRYGAMCGSTLAKAG